MSTRRFGLYGMKELLVMVGCFVFLTAVTSYAATPIPTVTGPIKVTANSYPFGAANHLKVPMDLSKLGYVEEEFTVSGKANVYNWVYDLAKGAYGPAVVQSTDAPYATRILVRRPANRARFSGNVMVEILNPTNWFDLEIGWAFTHDQLLLNGDAWVGITIKPIAINALQTFDPVRYASLAMLNPLPLSDPRNCATVAADSSRYTENGLAWDVISQVGALLKSSVSANPLQKYKVKHLYGFGYSQAGGYLQTYINTIHPLDVQANGKALYDGYIIGTFAGMIPINQCFPELPGVYAAQLTQTDPRWFIFGVGVPVFRVMTQSEYFQAITLRRPDGDTFPDLYRYYEVAGAAHATPTELDFGPTAADIAKAGRPYPETGCYMGLPRSRFPVGMIFDGAWANLDLWVRKGIAPPHADVLAVNPAIPAGYPPTLLDPFGNAIGGVRTPYVDVPISTWFVNSPGDLICNLSGFEIPFDAATLQFLYPTHSDYVQKVVKDALPLVQQRFLTLMDGLKIVVEAVRADVP